MCRATRMPSHGLRFAYRSFFFVNAGGPLRKVLRREVVQKKWQLVTLDCSHQILLPKYQKSAKVSCGFCGGLEPLAKGAFMLFKPCVFTPVGRRNPPGNSSAMTACAYWLKTT